MDTDENPAKEILNETYQLFELRRAIKYQSSYLKKYSPDAEINEYSLKILKSDYTQARKKLEKKLNKVLCTCSCTEQTDK